MTDFVKPGETFVIVDAGGGTVDVATYTVDKQYPLRLKKEAVAPDGENLRTNISFTESI